MFEPAQHTDGFATNAGVGIVQRCDGRRCGIGETQFAQGAERGHTHADVSVVGPRQYDSPRRFSLEQAQALRGGGLHGRRRIRQCLAQRLHDVLILPGFQQPRGFSADFFSRIQA